jgi:hypothetical protein
MDYSYTGDEFSDLGNANNPAAVSYGAYSSVGARATLHTEGYEIGLFVDNLGDNRGRVAARTYFLENVEIRQMPRTIGATFRKEW